MVGADGVVTLVTFFESHTHGVVCAEPWIPSARRGLAPERFTAP
jgi:hypothetical protein